MVVSFSRISRLYDCIFKMATLLNVCILLRNLFWNNWLYLCQAEDFIIFALSTFEPIQPSSLSHSVIIWIDQSHNPFLSITCGTNQPQSIREKKLWALFERNNSTLVCHILLSQELKISREVDFRLIYIFYVSAIKQTEIFIGCQRLIATNRFLTS